MIHHLLQHAALSILLSAVLLSGCSPAEENSPALINIDSLPTMHIAPEQGKVLMDQAVNMANDPAIDTAGYIEVISILDKLISIDPDYPNVFLMKANIQEFIGIPGFAETQKIADRKEVERDLFVAMTGKSLEDTGDSASAQAYYENVAAKSKKSLDSIHAELPNRSLIQINYIVALICLEKTNEAATASETAYAASLDLFERKLLRRLMAATRKDLYTALENGAWPEEEYGLR